MAGVSSAKNKRKDCMRTKPRSNSIVHGLPPEQRERVDYWLFEENVSYSEVADRCRKILDVKVSRAAVHRYYERECVARRLEGAACPGRERKKLAASLGKRTEEDYSIAVGIASQAAADEALKPEDHGDVKKFNDAMRVMVAVRQEENERKRIALQAERTAQHGRKVALLEKRFQFSASVECLKHAREMEIIMKKKEWDDGDRVMEIRERFFGPNLPE
ncbi:MAG: hypothetical protein JWR26_353 [Pedosphaera sp.]|nr:hypothetical protein [Pedosphaera sp.]